MKKALILAVAALFISAPTVLAQSKVKVDKDSFLKKIEKSDADIANPKKNTKAATWLTRGKLFYDVENAVSGQVFEGLNLIAANIMFGEPMSKEATVLSGLAVDKVTYPYLVGYFGQEDGLLRAWEITYVIDKDAISKSVEAYAKAYEIDQSKKTADLVAEGLKNNYDILYKRGSVNFALGKYLASAKDFEQAYKITQYKGYVIPSENDTPAALAHDTGLAFLFAPDYANSIKYLKIAESEGHYKDGDVYYLMYHAFKGISTPENQKEVLGEAKNMLLKGLEKYPENANIIECLTDVYVALGEDPRDIIPAVELAISKDPKNPALWNGLGRVYERLGEIEKSIEAFEHVAEIEPTNASAFFSVGLLYLQIGEAKGKEVDADSSLSTQAQYDAAIAKVFEIYAQSVAPLERAYELSAASYAKNNDAYSKSIMTNSVELLKNVTFRLRDIPGMGEKNTKYTEILEKIQ